MADIERNIMIALRNALNGLDQVWMNLGVDRAATVYQDEGAWRVDLAGLADDHDPANPITSLTKREAPKAWMRVTLICMAYGYSVQDDGLLVATDELE